MLCEDDPDIAIVLREQLRQVGFATDFAYTAGEALKSATASRYCAFLVDIRLPDSDGIDLIAGLRRMQQYVETPIIVVSADAGRGREDPRSSNLKVFQWLSKPVDFGQLIKALTENVAPHTMHSA